MCIVICGFFFKVNGMSNRYWGWGREDDELYVRLRRAGLQVMYTVYLQLMFELKAMNTNIKNNLKNKKC